MASVAAYPVKVDYWSSEEGIKLKRGARPRSRRHNARWLVVVIDYEPYAIQAEFDGMGFRCLLFAVP